MRSPDCCDRASARCAILECVSGPRDTSNRADTALISDKSLIESSLTPELGVSAVLSRPGFAFRRGVAKRVIFQRLCDHPSRHDCFHRERGARGVRVRCHMTRGASKKSRPHGRFCNLREVFFAPPPPPPPRRRAAAEDLLLVVVVGGSHMPFTHVVQSLATTPPPWW